MRAMIISTAVLAAVLLLLVIPADQGSDAAKPVILEGDIVLEEDMVFEDGSIINIMNGTSIDMASFSIDFGRDSDIVIIGLVSITCGTGSITMGEGTTVVIDAHIIPGPDEDAVIRFDGTVSMEFSIWNGLSIEFAPAGDDRSIHIKERTTTIAITDPSLRVSLVIDGLGYSAEFSTFSKTVRSYDGDELISTDTTIMDGNGENCRIEFTRTLLGIRLSALEFYSLSDVERFESTGNVSATTVEGFGPTEIGIDGHVMHIITRADSVSLERTGPENDGYCAIFRDVTLATYIDLDELAKAFDPERADDHGHVFRALELRSPEATVQSEGGEPRELTDLYIVLDGSSADYVIEAGFTEGDETTVLTATEIDVQSFGIATDLKVDLVADIGIITLVKTVGGEEASRLTATDSALGAIRLDAVALYRSYAKSGSLTLQGILDSCDRFSLDIGEMIYDADGDGATDATLRKMSGILTVDGRGVNTLTLNADYLLAQFPYKEGEVEVLAGDVLIYAESTGSLNELADAFLSRVHFTEDTRAEIQLDTGSLAVAYLVGNDAFQIRSEKIASTAPRHACLSLSVEHSMYEDKTTLSANISCIGYFTTLDVLSEIEDPAGEFDLQLRGADLAGSFTMSFADGISFGANLSFPWTLEADYYDIAFQAEGNGCGLALSHGALDVDDYDYRGQGIIAIISAMENNDFLISTRASMTADEVVVYTDDWQTVHGRATDFELDIRTASFELQRGVQWRLLLESLELDLVNSDGSKYTRYIPVVDLVSDLSGESSEPWVEANSGALAYVFAGGCAAVIVGIAALRWRRPELFKFNEDEP